MHHMPTARKRSPTVRNSAIRGFRARVLRIVAEIPVGRALSYGEVAALAGSSRAARAVGNIMRNNRDPQLPCHRVVRADGSAGGYNRGGAAAKRARLKAEGVVVK
jgi:O-6-methylguanine DNA methyltransferase